MSKGKKRTRITSSKNSASKITVRAHQYQKRGVYYDTWLVQGWKENGKWQKKQFKSEDEAKSFASTKQIEKVNTGRKQDLHLTSLNESQLREAEDAIKSLGDSYTIKQAIEYFLKNHRHPEQRIAISSAMRIYLDDCENEGTRTRTITQKRLIIEKLFATLDDCDVDNVTKEQAEAFLRNLRGKDGVSKATRKTWNNCRNELNHFFKWAGESDLSTNRPYTFQNPIEAIKTFTARQVADQRKPIAVTPPDKLMRRFSALMSWKGGDMAKFFALLYFAGIRPDAEHGEIAKLGKREKELINLETRTIHIPANVSKTKEARQVYICDNLLAWLKAYEDRPLIPSNHGRMMRRVRKAFKISHDETRHSFISYHVALHRSLGDVALQAGNSESMVKKHYLNLRPAEEGTNFFSIVPDMKTGKAVYAENVTTTEANLRVI
jgi:hypothetical protein